MPCLLHQHSTPDLIRRGARVPSAGLPSQLRRLRLHCASSAAAPPTAVSSASSRAVPRTGPPLLPLRRLRRRRQRLRLVRALPPRRRRIPPRGSPLAREGRRVSLRLSLVGYYGPEHRRTFPHHELVLVSPKASHALPPHTPLPSPLSRPPKAQRQRAVVLPPRLRTRLAPTPAPPPPRVRPRRRRSRASRLRSPRLAARLATACCSGETCCSGGRSRPQSLPLAAAAAER